MDFNQDLLDEKSFLKGNRRYHVDPESNECDDVRNFLESKQFTHYYIPHKPKLKRVGNQWQKIPVDLNKHSTFTPYSQKTEKQADETPKKILMSVVLLSSKNWSTFLSNQFKGLLTGLAI